MSLIVNVSTALVGAFSGYVFGILKMKRGSIMQQKNDLLKEILELQKSFSGQLKECPTTDQSRYEVKKIDLLLRSYLSGRRLHFISNRRILSAWSRFKCKFDNTRLVKSYELYNVNTETSVEFGNMLDPVLDFIAVS